VDQPSALDLAIAAAFAPLSNQEFVSALVFNGKTSIGIDFASCAPVALGARISQELPGVTVKLRESGIEIDISTLKSRAEVLAAGVQVAEILVAAGSTTTQISESEDVRVKKFDPRDREFLDNVPPHHGV
jgi:hypothetical protein